MIEITEDNNFVVPSDPELRKQIRNMISEADNILTMMDGQKAALKDIKDRAKEELEVPTKIFNKMLKAFHKQQYAAMAQENEVFQLFYEQIMEDPS